MTSINLNRKKVSKNSIVFTRMECPKGLGYYSLKEYDCTIYRACEPWDEQFVMISLNKCVKGRYFSFDQMKCVKSIDNLSECNRTELKFAAID